MIYIILSYSSHRTPFLFYAISGLSYVLLLTTPLSSLRYPLVRFFFQVADCLLLIYPISFCMDVEKYMDTCMP